MRAVALGLFALLVMGAWAEDVIISAPNSHPNRAVSINLYYQSTNSVTTNMYEVAESEPFVIRSVFWHNEFDGVSQTNTVSLSANRIYAIERQVVGDVVSTNLFGRVVTNHVDTVTNIVYQTATIPIVSETTITGNVHSAVATPFVYKAADVFVTEHTDDVGALISGDR